MVGLLRGTLMDGEILTNLVTLFCVDPVGEDFSSPLYWQRFPWLVRYLLFGRCASGVMSRISRERRKQ